MPEKSIASFLLAQGPFADWGAISDLADMEIEDPPSDGEFIGTEDFEAWVEVHPCVYGDVPTVLDSFYEEFGDQLTWEDWCIGEYFHVLCEKGLSFECCGCAAKFDKFDASIRRFCSRCAHTLKHKTAVRRELKMAGVRERDILRQPPSELPFYSPDYRWRVVDIRKIKEDTEISSATFKLRRRNKDGHQVPRSLERQPGLYAVADVKAYLLSDAAARHTLPAKAMEVRELLMREELARAESKLKALKGQLYKRRRQ